MAQQRTARIEARIAPEAMAVVKRAAEIQGRSVSDFVVAAAQEAAHRTIEETSLIRPTEAIRTAPQGLPRPTRAADHELIRRRGGRGPGAADWSLSGSLHRD